MAVFRIEKNSDFTIMPNYPFRDMRLSFKGRGLLGTMLTLRDDWDYTLAGLTAISPHGNTSAALCHSGAGGHKGTADLRHNSAAHRRHVVLRPELHGEAERSRPRQRDPQAQYKAGA